jgi:hypothetical protein
MSLKTTAAEDVSKVIVLPSLSAGTPPILTAILVPPAPRKNPLFSDVYLSPGAAAVPSGTIRGPMRVVELPPED